MIGEPLDPTGRPSRIPPPWFAERKRIELAHTLRWDSHNSVDVLPLVVLDEAMVLRSDARLDSAGDGGMGGSGSP